MRATWKKGAPAFGALLLAVMGLTITSGQDRADAAPIPNPVGSPFTADACPGSTQFDPVAAGGSVPDLTLVFGQRLAEYNNGQIVPLYDAYGRNELDGYPAVCGVRFVAGVGAVSEWMFCTDYFSHVCSGVDGGGNLLNINGDPIAGMDPLTGNPKIAGTPAERIVAYLVNAVHSYAGVGYFDFGTATEARADGTSDERAALQVLIWCLSDPPAPGAVGTEGERAATCANNMSPTEQTRILALIPSAPTVSLALTAPSTSLPVGDTATFSLTTNLFNQPISLVTSGTDPVQVISGPATIVGSTVTVAGTDPTVPVTVILAIVGSSTGGVIVDASAQPPSVTNLGWNQSPGLGRDNVPCQIFAAHYQEAQLQVSGRAAVTFTALPTGTGGAAQLAPTGLSPQGFVVGAGALLTAGTAVVAVASLRRRSESRED